MEAERLLLEKAAAQTAAGSVETGQSSVSGAELTVLPDGTTVTRAQAVELKKLELKRNKTQP